MTTTALGTPSPRHWSVSPVMWAAIAGWIALNVAAVWLSGGVLPFDRPAVEQFSFVQQMAVPSIGLFEIFGLMVLVYFLTRNRPELDIAARAPAPARSAAETAILLAYAFLVQIGGWFLGPALGLRPFSFHLAGTLVGCSFPPTVPDALLWMGYNFVCFACIPYFSFRVRYTNEQLNLKSAVPRADLLLIVVIATIESMFELAAFPGILHMVPRDLAIAAPLAFVLFGLGTVLPTMVLIYAILIPRYLRLTGSFAGTVLLGGLTYAAMHIVEGWSNFSNARDVTLSLIFVVLTYVGPGMFKSFVTLRTGNAWVHAIGYHAIAPHVVVDTPLVAKIFLAR